MRLKGEHFKQLRDALLDAFKFESLRSMVRIELDMDLDEIVSRGTFQEQVEELILWAERNKRVKELVAGARKTNPGNKKLETAEERLLSAGEDAYFVTALEDVDRGEPTYGDNVGGDKIEVGDITEATGVAIGRGAKVEVHQHVVGRELRDEQYETVLNWESKGRPRMRGFDLSARDLSTISLTSADLQEAILRKTKLYGANLSGTFFIKANLSEADLRKATLIGTNFIASNLRGARLNRSNLEWARLNRADLSAANLSGADLEDAELSEAKYTVDTVWPDGFDPKVAGAILVDNEGNPVEDLNEEL